MMHRPITTYKLARALVNAGLLTEDEINRTTRIVIDAKAGDAVTVYLQQIGDERYLDVAMGLGGIEIKSVDHHCGTEGPHTIPDDCTVNMLRSTELTAAIRDLAEANDVESHDRAIARFEAEADRIRLRMRREELDNGEKEATGKATEDPSE